MKKSKSTYLLLKTKVTEKYFHKHFYILKRFYYSIKPFFITHLFMYLFIGAAWGSTAVTLRKDA